MTAVGIAKELTMDMTNLRGSIVALVTPFKEDQSVDFDALERLVDFHLANGTDGILVLGTTGESSTMTDEEDFAVAKCVIDRVAGRVPVIGGSGSNATAESLNKSLGLQKLGIDGLLLITPYYNKSNEEGIYRHFTTVLDAADVPCILYNIPGRTGCSISERNVARLSKHPQRVGHQGGVRQHLVCHDGGTLPERRLPHALRQRRHGRAHPLARRIRRHQRLG